MYIYIHTHTHTHTHTYLYVYIHRYLYTYCASSDDSPALPPSFPTEPFRFQVVYLRIKIRVVHLRIQ